MKKLLLSLLAMATFVACNNNDRLEETPIEQTVLPVKMKSGYYDEQGTFHLESDVRLDYAGNKLSKITYLETGEDGSQSTEVTTITYQGDLITKISDSESTHTFTYDNQGNLIKEVEEYVGENTIYTRTCNYTISGNKVTANYTQTNTYSGSSNTSEGTIVFTLDANKQVIHSLDTSKSYQSTHEATYVYDTKNAAFKNVTGLDKLSYSSFRGEQLSVPHNIIASSEEYKSSYTNNLSEYKHQNEYNTLNFPLKKDILHKQEDGSFKKTSTITIEYNK
ncbi:hypothetical protein PG279_04420 [Riemerella anatipestifer]|nr:hypothetical protein [Riemerella anatipestifer]